MRGLHAAAGVPMLLLFAAITQSSRGWVANDTAEESSRLTSVRTYAPREFHQTLLDRLSGGLVQQFPYRMAIGSQGRILVTDPVLSVVHVFDTRQGKRWQIRGDRRHRLGAPEYIAVDADDNIYVTEVRRSVVFVLQPNGHLMRTIGLGVLKLPTGIWVDKQNRTLYVADSMRDEVLSFDLEGKLLRVLGSRGTGPGQLLHPLDIVLHRDTLVVLDAGNSRFELFDPQGNLRSTWPFGVNRTPISFAFDAAGNLYYVDGDSGGLVAMDPQGKVLAEFDQQRRFGQWTPRSTAGPNFRCVAADALGKILALRSTLDVEVLVAATNAAQRAATPPTSTIPPAPAQAPEAKLQPPPVARPGALSPPPAESLPIRATQPLPPSVSTTLPQVPVPASTAQSSTGQEETAPHQAAKGDKLGMVRSVTVTRDKDVIEVHIEGNKPLRASASTLSNPERIVIDLAGVACDRSRRLAVNAADVEGVRMALFQADPPVTRVVVDLAHRHEYRLLPVGSTVILAIDTSTKPVLAAQPAETKVAAVAPIWATQPSAPAVSTTLPQVPVPVSTAQSSTGQEETAPHQTAKGNKPGTVRSVTVRRDKDVIEVHIEGSKSLRASASTLSNPERIVIDLAGVAYDRSRRLAVNAADVEGVRMALFQADPPVTRVVVDLARPHPYNLQTSGNSLTVRIETEGIRAAAQAAR